TAREAFVLMKSLIEAAKIQLMMEATGDALFEIPSEVAEKTARQYEHHDSGRGSADWPAYQRMLDEKDASWRN
ncbi:MAG: class II aldolase/adducin family protein, partial [Bradyrhizobiaceae bacterium]|nr:class II aldolase/adducin family protein [Bradyrhizobiaceae bacterium]